MATLELAVLFRTPRRVAFERQLARPDAPDLPRRAHVFHCAGDPDRRTTRLPPILMGWLQRRHLDRRALDRVVQLRADQNGEAGEEECCDVFFGPRRPPGSPSSLLPLLPNCLERVRMLIADLPRFLAPVRATLTVVPAVPTLAGWAMIMLTALLGLAGVMAMRRRAR